MKISTVLAIAGLMMFPVIGLAQTSEILVSPVQPVTTVTSSQTAETFSTCEVISFRVGNECGLGMYTSVNFLCSDGEKSIIGDGSSCKDVDVWHQYANEACANRCSSNNTSQFLLLPVTSVMPKTTSTPTTFGGSTGGGSEAISTKAIQMPATQTTTVPAPAPVPTPTISITPAIYPQTTAVSSLPIKCGVNSFGVSNECGLGVYKNVYAQCYDGYKTNLGASESSCKSSETWQQYAKEACANRCSNERIPGTVFTGGEPSGISTEVPITTVTTRPVEIPRTTPVCYFSDDLMQKYNQLIIELQKTESDKTRTEEITKQIIALKQQISAQQKKCVDTVPQQQTSKIILPASIVQQLLAENIPIGVAIDRCNEVVQWETKITYYKKLGSLSDDELKKSGFSREEIGKILQELSLGIEKVKAQCTSQEKTPVITRAATITGSAFIAETVKPVVIESGQGIDTYYKARLEKAVSAKGEEKQIQELKTLRDEIDGLISNLIKSRKELEVSELNTLVKEVKVSRGEIKADDITVKTTEKKILVNVGDRSVSIEPTADQVLIRDKGLEVNTDEVTIKENVLSVGGADVKMSASEVTEKLGLVPKKIELKEEDAKAVYSMTIDEQRKLFGFIPFNSQKTITADAENGTTLSEQVPWYNFLTTK